MREDIKLVRWTCDNPECKKEVISQSYPAGWTHSHPDCCCHACWVNLQGKPDWYADLCVDVTLADVVAGARGLIQPAVCNIAGANPRLSTAPHSDDEYARDLLLHRGSWKKETLIGTKDGIAFKAVNGEIVCSPHSIVRLICPTFAEACEHPVEFMAMYYDACGVHAKLSDVGKMTTIASKLDTIVNVVRAASEKAASERLKPQSGGLWTCCG